MKLWEKYKMDLMVWSWDEYKRTILSLLDRDPKARLLDLGSSNMVLTERIASTIGTRDVICVDLLEKPSSLLPARWIRADLNGPLPIDGFYDVIVASQVIEHLWNTDGLMKEISRLLAPEGYVIISTPNLAAWHNIAYLVAGRQPETAEVSDEMDPEKEKPGHRRIFTSGELIRFLRFHGFSIERIVGSAFPPFCGSLARLACRTFPMRSGTVTVKARKNYLPFLIGKEWLRDLVREELGV